MFTSSEPGSEHLAGSTLTLTCDILVNVNVDTPHFVSSVWTRNESTIQNSSRISIHDPSAIANVNQYRTELDFDTLSSIYDTGLYACTISVESVPFTEYISDSPTQTEVVEIAVKGL